MHIHSSNSTIDMFKLLFWLYYFTIGLPIFIITTILTCLVIISGCALGYGDWASRYPGRVWGRLSLWLHWCPVDLSGLEHLVANPRSAYVVVANHQSAFDIFALYGYIDLPFKWVLKEELRRMPFVGWACQAAGFIFVDDSSPASIARTMSDASATLCAGNSIFIFPEGSRTLTGRMARFKKGGFVMASELDVPILPISIDGAYDVLRRGDLLATPHKISLVVHPPFRISSMGEYPASIAASARHAQQTIASVLSREQSQAQ